MAELNTPNVEENQVEELESPKMVEETVEESQNLGTTTPKEAETPVTPQNNEFSQEEAIIEPAQEEITPPEPTFEPAPVEITPEPVEIAGVTPEVKVEEEKEVVATDELSNTDKIALSNFDADIQAWTLTREKLVEYAMAKPNLVEQYRNKYVAYSKAQRVNKKVTTFSNYTPSQLYEATQNGDIVKWDDTWNQLPEALKQSYNSFESVQESKNLSNRFSKVNETKINTVTDLSSYVNMYTSLYNTWSYEKVEKLLNNPRLTTSSDKLNNIKSQIDDLDDTLEAIEDDVRKENPWATESKITAIVSNRQKDIYKTKNSLTRQYNTELSNFQRIKDGVDDQVEAIKADDELQRNIYSLALNKYESDQKAMNDAEIAKFEAENKEVTRKRAIEDEKNMILWKNKIANGEVKWSWKELDDGLYFLTDEWEATKVLDGNKVSSSSVGESVVSNYKNDDGTYTSIEFNKKTKQRTVSNFDAQGNIVTKWASSIEGDDFSWLASEYPWEAWASNNNPAGITYTPTALQRFINAWIDVKVGSDRPEEEWWQYFKFASIQDWFKAYENTWNQSWYQDKTVRGALSLWGTWALPLDETTLNKKVSDLTDSEQRKLIVEQIKKESPWLYKEMTKRGWIWPDTFNIPAKTKPVVKKDVSLSSKKFGQLNTIKDSFSKAPQVKTFVEAWDWYDKLVTALRSNSWPWDIAAVFTFMKTLDPSSVVREWEFQQAAESAWIVEGWKNIFNKASTWEQLTPKQREQFAEISKQFILNSARKIDEEYNRTVDQIRAQIPWIDDVFLPGNPAQRYLDEFESDIWEVWAEPTETQVINHKWKDYTVSEFKTRVIEWLKQWKITQEQAKQMLKFNLVGGFPPVEITEEIKGYSNSYKPTVEEDFQDDFFLDFVDKPTVSQDDELRELLGEPKTAEIIYTDVDGIDYTQDTLKEEIERNIKEEWTDRKTIREWLKRNELLDTYPEYKASIWERIKEETMVFWGILWEEAKRLWGAVRDVWVWTLKWVAEWVVNLADLSDQALDATLWEGLRAISGWAIDPRDRWVREAFEWDRKLIENVAKAIADEESLAFKTWEVAWELGTTSLIPSWWIAKVWEKLSKIPWAWKVLLKISEKSPELLKNLSKATIEWLEEWAKFGAVTEWTPEAVVETAVVWAVASPLVGTVAKVSWDAIKKLSTRLTTSWLVNPAKLTKINNQLKASGIEEFSDVDATAKYLLERWIKWDKDSIVNQLRQVGSSSKKQVDDALATINTLYKDEAIDKWLNAVINELKGKSWLENELFKARELLLKSQKWEGLTLTELNNAKRLMWNNLNIFNETWAISKEAKARWFANILDDAKISIETKAAEAWLPDIRLLNKETQVSTELANAIVRKEAAEEARELLASYIISPGAGWIIWWFTGDTWEERAKNAMIWAVTWGVAWSTRIKSNVWSFFNKLTSAEKKSLQDYVESRAITLLPTALEQKIEDFIDSNK